jgi:hypothetical protein
VAIAAFKKPMNALSTPMSMAFTLHGPTRRARGPPSAHGHFKESRRCPRGSKVVDPFAIEFAGKYRVPQAKRPVSPDWDIDITQEAVSGTLIVLRR